MSDMLQILQETVDKLGKRPELPSLLVMNKFTWYAARQDFRSMMSYRRWHGRRWRFLGGVPVYLFSEVPDEMVWGMLPQKPELFDYLTPSLEYEHLIRHGYGRGWIGSWVYPPVTIR